MSAQKAQKQKNDTFFNELGDYSNNGIDSKMSMGMLNRQTNNMDFDDASDDDDDDDDEDDSDDSDNSDEEDDEVDDMENNDEGFEAGTRIEQNMGADIGDKNLTVVGTGYAGDKRGSGIVENWSPSHVKAGMVGGLGSGGGLMSEMDQLNYFSMTNEKTINACNSNLPLVRLTFVDCLFYALVRKLGSTDFAVTNLKTFFEK